MCGANSIESNSLVYRRKDRLGLKVRTQKLGAQDKFTNVSVSIQPIAIRIHKLVKFREIGSQEEKYFLLDLNRS
jgi:hypothetical protein